MGTRLDPHLLKEFKEYGAVGIEKCFNCGNCYMYCPDNAVKISPKTGLYEFDLDFCKGCGLCAASCPSKAVDMCHFSHHQIRAQICALA